MVKKSSTKTKKKKSINLVEDGISYRKKKQSKIDNGTFEFFKKSNLKNFIEVPFNELVNSEFPNELNKFNIVKKRTYCNKIDLIIDYNNRIFNAYPNQEDLVMTYLAIKWKIDKKSYEDKVIDGKTIKAERFFLDDLYNQLFNENFNNFLIDWVEENYDLDIDTNNKEKVMKNYNPVLQFSDKHCKMLQAISLGMKISIPLLLHFFSMYAINDPTNDYLQRSFDFLFKIFSFDKETGKNVDLYSKLWESVYSRVVVTNNSDKSYWKYVEIEGTNINNVTQGFYQKLIVDIVPKYEIDKNLINLNHVFINNNMDYTLRSNIEINYKPLNLAENEDDVSDWEA